MGSRQCAASGRIHSLFEETPKQSQAATHFAMSTEALSVNPSRNEHTIASSCEVVGRGYWSGKHVRVVCNPSPAGSGITLVRSDLPDRPSCPALTQYAYDANFRTNLCNGDAKFAMVEHLMAALSGLEIDNCVVEIDAEELPGLDGSSLAFAEALIDAGLIVQAAIRRRLVVERPIRVEADGCWIDALPLVTAVSGVEQGAYYEYRLDYEDSGVVPPQTFGVLSTPQRFASDIAGARTFVTADQAAMLRSQGVASHVTNQDLVVLGPDGPVDNTFRFDNECARHKTLDLIGDLALAGVDLAGHFVSYRGGHILNGRMASELATLAAGEQSHTHQSSLRDGSIRRAA